MLSLSTILFSKVTTGVEVLCPSCVTKWILGSHRASDKFNKILHKTRHKRASNLPHTLLPRHRRDLSNCHHQRPSFGIPSCNAVLTWWCHRLLHVYHPLLRMHLQTCSIDQQRYAKSWSTMMIYQGHCSLVRNVNWQNQLKLQSYILNIWMGISVVNGTSNDNRICIHYIQECDITSMTIHDVAMQWRTRMVFDVICKCSVNTYCYIPCHFSYVSVVFRSVYY